MAGLDGQAGLACPVPHFCDAHQHQCRDEGDVGQHLEELGRPARWLQEELVGLYRPNRRLAAAVRPQAARDEIEGRENREAVAACYRLLDQRRLAQGQACARQPAEEARDEQRNRPSAHWVHARGKGRLQVLFDRPQSQSATASDTGRTT